MAPDGRPTRPRPPRRIPAAATGANQRTSIEPRHGPRSEPQAPEAPSPPPTLRRRRFGLLVLVLVLLAVTAAGAGWMVREEQRELDPAKVLRLNSPAVVRVLATTCGGTGQATGVRLGDDLVLTAASAIRGPVSVAVETTTGQVRRAVVLGVNAADGIAVLRVVGALQGGIAAPAPEEPGSSSERAILGYTADGSQTLQSAGPSKARKPLTQIIGEGSLGAPLLDNQGRVVGLVTGDTVAGGKVVPLERVRSYLGRPPISNEPRGRCDEARGPQTPQTPVLTTARTPLAGEVTDLLTSFLNRLNQHDLRGVRALHTADFRARVPLDGHIAQYRTSYVFGARIGQVVTDGPLVRAEMSYTILHWTDGPIGVQTGAGVTCSCWQLSYVLVRVDGKLRIFGVNGVRKDALPWRSCDS